MMSWWQVLAVQEIGVFRNLLLKVFGWMVYNMHIYKVIFQQLLVKADIPTVELLLDIKDFSCICCLQQVTNAFLNDWQIIDVLDNHWIVCHSQETKERWVHHSKLALPAMGYRSEDNWRF